MKHVQVIHGVLKFRCNKCEFGTITRYSLTKHKQSLHNPDVENSGDINQLQYLVNPDVKRVNTRQTVGNI